MIDTARLDTTTTTEQEETETERGIDTILGGTIGVIVRGIGMVVGANANVSETLTIGAEIAEVEMNDHLVASEMISAVHHHHHLLLRVTEVLPRIDEAEDVREKARSKDVPRRLTALFLSHNVSGRLLVGMSMHPDMNNILLCKPSKQVNLNVFYLTMFLSYCN